MTKVFQRSQLPEGHMHAVTVGDYDVLLANVKGQIYAIENKCSHYAFALSKGALCDHEVRCPLHSACFDVRTGRQTETPGLDGVPAFEVKLDGDDIYVLDNPVTSGQSLVGNADVAPSEPKDHYQYAVLGGGIAAANAVEAIRAGDPDGSIVLVSKEKLPPYDRTKVSKALMAGGAEVEKLPLRSEDYYRQNRIDLRLLTRIETVDVGEKKVILENGGGFTYDKVLLATGSTPRELRVPGADLENVYTVRKAKDGKAIRENAGEGTEVIVVGGSFIGLETAASLSGNGAKVTVVTPEDVILEKVFGEKVGRLIQSMHEEAGVTFKLGRKLERIEGDGAVGGVVLDNGDELPAKMVVAGIGVVPNTDYLVGLASNQDGGLSVNGHLGADVGDVFVAGDIASYPGREGEVRIEHWKVAGMQGRVAGRNMTGAGEAYTTLPFFWSAQQGTNFRYAGHGTDYDKIVFDGEPGAGPFLAFYVKDKHVQAALGMKRDGEMAAIGHLLERRRMPPVNELVGRDWHALCREV